MRVVLDTSVMVAGVRSRRGSSFALLEKIPADEFQPCLSVALYTEWRAALSRAENIPPGENPASVYSFLRFVAGHCHLQEIYFLWRPYLRDPGDDHVLELAFASGSRYIVTHNVRDFRGSERLGVQAVTPRNFLRMLETLP